MLKIDREMVRCETCIFFSAWAPDCDTDRDGRCYYDRPPKPVEYAAFCSDWAQAFCTNDPDYDCHSHSVWQYLVNDKERERES